MKRHYELTPYAQADLDALTLFIAEESVQTALRVLDALENAFELLAENPGIGHSREDLTPARVKFWPVFSYLVVYRPEKKPLEIIAVVHGARDIPRVISGRDE